MVQISEDLYRDLLRYHLEGRQDEAITERIRLALIAKQEARIRRFAYGEALKGNDAAREIVEELKTHKP